MAVADALDEIRTRNARNEQRERQEREDEEAARRAFMRRQEAMEEIIEDEPDDAGVGPAPITKEEALSMPPPSFKRVVKKKKDHAAALGIKKKPALV
ncbi:mRNA splicing yju2 protein [Rutstroemia sp. NJR-2017a BBW]|nr:mRNA splicing yju2 protein [Rutstroemia sp. NJR-2017a BBW]